MTKNFRGHHVKKRKRRTDEGRCKAKIIGKGNGLLAVTM